MTDKPTAIGFASYQQKTGCENETIVAQATAPGKSGIGIIRVSGPQALAITKAIIGELPTPRYAHYAHFLDSNGDVIDVGLTLYFQSPHSFTGEDVVEFHGHGGTIVLDSLIQRILSLGARLARPGEFSERAFLNDKIDLTQAEAIADLIDAGSSQAARAAIRSLQGDFSKRIRSLVEELINIRVYVEAAIDFPDEEIDFLNHAHITQKLLELLQDIEQIQKTAQQGALLRDGLTIVIAGRPNAGKSSLLNSLSGRDSAIVTAIPGTTRDLLKEHIHIDGIPLHIIDTAGLHESSDIIEQEGIRRAWDAITQADHILLVVDGEKTRELDIQKIWPEFTQVASSQQIEKNNLIDTEKKLELINETTNEFSSLELNKKEFSQFELKQIVATKKLTIIVNKIDLLEEAPELINEQEVCVVKVSAKTGAGIDLLRNRLKYCAGYQSEITGNFSARRRHIDALNRAKNVINNGLAQLQNSRASELLAEELRQAQYILAEITGDFSSDDLLGEIFSSFCIGK